MLLNKTIELTQAPGVCKLNVPSLFALVCYVHMATGVINCVRSGYVNLWVFQNGIEDRLRKGYFLFTPW